MTPEILTWLWFGAGLALIATEFVLPGAVLGFLGASALVVSGAHWLGWVESPGASLGLWLALSALSVLTLRGAVQRWSAPERKLQATDEDADAFGKVAEVVERLGSGAEGRIRFRGSTWPARAVRGEVEAGIEVRIVDRDNLIWIVEPLVPVEAVRGGDRINERA